MFGIPLATGMLTFFGAGPLWVVLAAWMIPIAAVMILPDSLREVAEPALGRILGRLLGA